MIVDGVSVTDADVIIIIVRAGPGQSPPASSTRGGKTARVWALVLDSAYPVLEVVGRSWPLATTSSAAMNACLSS